ncbi:MAG: glycosyltransferase family 39 protein [Bacteroidota bacterium]
MNRTTRLAILVVFAGLLLSFFLQEGMFFDGVTYAAISKNLAHGLGSFWAPHYTQTLYPQFFEHPPLVFGLQSLFFVLFGDGPATERIYTIFMTLLCLFLIASIWKLFYPDKTTGKWWPLPVLLWIITPVVFWSSRNNMLENTLTVFILSSAWFTCKGLLTGRILWFLPGGAFILAAFLSKGPVGLFPLALPLWYFISCRNIRFPRFLLYLFTLAATPAILFLLLIRIEPDAGQNISNYLQQQVWPSLGNQRENVAGSHFLLLFKLAGNLVLPFMASLIFAVMKGKPDKRETGFKVNASLFFFLTALSASLPLLITLKQRDFYLVPSIPFFALAMCAWLNERGCLPGCEDGNQMRRIARWYSLFLWLEVVGVTVLFTFKSDTEPGLIRDVEVITREVPSGSIISGDKIIYSDWPLVACLSRYGNISIDDQHLNHWYLIRKNAALPDTLAGFYHPSYQKLKSYQLFTR